MKIGFVIASINSKSNGLGGHYHSLLETVEQLSSKHDVFIINIGNNPAKALEDTKFKLFSIIDKGYAIFRTYKKIIGILKDEQPDILHAFDSSAFYWVRLVGHKFNVPFCLTKCGGVNPVYFPYVNDLVLFSAENLEYFKSRKKFKHSHLYLIPNRIKQFNDDNNRIRQICNKLGKYIDAFKFLRITRIGNYYHKSSLQLINLVNQLNYEGINCCAVFIGTVEDIEYLKALKKEGKENCFFFTDERFTKNAKALIDCADAVLGTGRSFMEAAAKGKILLSPVKNSKFPALITLDNFDKAFYFNFSERIQLDEFDENKNLLLIKNVINNNNYLKQQQQFSKSVFSNLFDAQKISEKYETVYQNLEYSVKKNYFDLFLHTLFIIRNYYK